MVGEMYIIAAKALLAKIQYEKKTRRSICKVLVADYVGITHNMMIIWMVYSKCQSMILLKYILVQ